MKVKQCQFNATMPCQNKGEACLTTATERKVYNEIIRQMQEKLEIMKLPEEDCNYVTGECCKSDEDEEVEIEFED